MKLQSIVVIASVPPFVFVCMNVTSVTSFGETEGGGRQREFDFLGRFRGFLQPFQAVLK